MNEPYRKTMRGLPEHLEMERKLGEAAIDYFMLNLRGGCNYSCLKCFSDCPPVQRPSMSEMQILGLIGQARDLGARVVVIAGEGEPLLAPNLRQIVRLNSKQGLITILFTNGSYLDGEAARFLIDHDCSVITSCDSLQSRTYELLTGGARADFDRVMANLCRFRSLLQSHVDVVNGVRVVRGAINMTLTLPAEHEVARLREFCGDDFLFVCNSIAPHGKAKGSLDRLCGSSRDVDRLRRTAARYSETRGPSAKSREGNCANLFHGVAIGSDGSILPCAYTQELSGLLGNVADMPLSKAVSIAKQFRDKSFERHGGAPCILRHRRYARILEDARLANIKEAAT